MGRFQLLDRVGQGSFRARLASTGHGSRPDRCLKIRMPNYQIARNLRERFRREAQMVAQLRHPGIVPVHEVLEVDGRPILVSDFIDGVPIEGLLNSQR